MTLREYWTTEGAERQFDCQMLWGETGLSLLGECGDSYLAQSVKIYTDKLGNQTIVCDNGDTYREVHPNQPTPQKMEQKMDVTISRAQIERLIERAQNRIARYTAKAASDLDDNNTVGFGFNRGAEHVAQLFLDELEILLEVADDMANGVYSIAQ